MNILEIKHVIKEYENKKALDSISLNVIEGRIFGLLGPNGAGKTTLIRIINQITAPDKGEILFSGERFKREHIQNIGYLPEERGLYKSMKVGEQCLYLAQLKGLSKNEAKQKIHHWFKKLDMLDWLNKKVEELSKGMAQKVQFVSTVLHQPKLIILDEPFTGFDPINSEIIKNEIIALKESGSTIILSTHRMESVEELCDDIALINSGQCIIEGSVNEIKNNFKEHIFEVQFEGTIQNEIQHFDTLVIESGYAIFKAKNKENTHTLIKQVVEQVNVTSFNEKLPTINDVFIQSVNNE
ncbi:MAG: ABC transporter ATP-binding protein [Flavobacteriales bacterium]|nr:ABC transporter ATP-binding protein [Flavobacteriales bacterium]HAP30940.1 ABC transporter ATP-binding protein [Flavobacteriales bacterium]|tara:strand:+ start:1086 stop:1976 length:891 start_codon:yes stop_codon:yes gene_type:complete